jgi:RAB6A-GEF complex partner protein 1
MYWPIGAPRIYAATKHERDDEQQTTSDDGSTTPTLRNKSLERGQNGDSALNDDEEDTEQAHSHGSKQKEPTPRKSEVAAGKEASKSNGTFSDDAEKDPGGQIVGIAVARSGHMFITITSSTLTVWQTKVNNESLHLAST